MKINILEDKSKQVRDTAHIERKKLTEMNVALKVKEEEGRQEVDEAMKTMDQKFVEMENVFDRRFSVNISADKVNTPVVIMNSFCK